MDIQQVASVAERMLWIAFIISLPLLGTSLVVGVLISILQTVTGVQEMTLTFVPKIASVLTVMVLMLPWMAQVLVNFTNYIFKVFAGQM